RPTTDFFQPESRLCLEGEPSLSAQPLRTQRLPERFGVLLAPLGVVFPADFPSVTHQRGQLFDGTRLAGPVSVQHPLGERVPCRVHAVTLVELVAFGLHSLPQPLEAVLEALPDPRLPLSVAK